MAQAPPRACRCGAVVPANERCPRCTAERKHRADERRGTAQQRGYDAAWRNAVRLWRAADPERNLCVECRKNGALRHGAITDHIVPHKGDRELFWSTANWQALCVHHHAVKTAREDGGFGNARQIV